MRVSILVCLASLSLAALACAAPGAEPTPTAAANPVATQTPGASASAEAVEPTAAVVEPGEATDAPATEPPPQGDDLPAILDLDDDALYAQPDFAQTYGTALDFRFVGMAADGEPITGTVSMAGEGIVEPYETSLTFFSFGRAINSDGGVMTFTQTTDTQYVFYPQVGCLSGPAGSQENPFAVFLDLGGMLMGEAQRLEQDEVVNEIDTAVYAITMENIDPNDPAGRDVLEINEGRLYVDKVNRQAVRLTLTGRGRSEVLSGDPALPGDIFYQLDYRDYDEPVEVEPPAVCAAVGELETPYPLPADATEANELAGIVSFRTGLSLEDARAFYLTEMAPLGCDAPQETTGGQLVQLTFAGCPFGTVNVVLAEDAARGDVIGTITPLP